MKAVKLRRKKDTNLKNGHLSSSISNDFIDRLSSRPKYLLGLVIVSEL